MRTIIELEDGEEYSKLSKMQFEMEEQEEKIEMESDRSLFKTYLYKM